MAINVLAVVNGSSEMSMHCRLQRYTQNTKKSHKKAALIVPLYKFTGAEIIAQMSVNLMLLNVVVRIVETGTL